MTSTIYSAIASRINARQHSLQAGNAEWYDKHGDVLKALQEKLPRGSGIDSGTQIDLDASGPERIILNLGYHHMNDNSMYDGWTEHQAIVTPSLQFGINIRITGRNRNQIKDYLHDCLHGALTAQIEE